MRKIQSLFCACVHFWSSKWLATNWIRHERKIDKGRNISSHLVCKLKIVNPRKSTKKITMAIYIRKYNPIDNNGGCVFSGFLSGPKPIFSGFSRNLFIESIRPHFLPSLFAFLLYFQLSVSQIKFKKDESSRFPPGNITNWRSGYRFVNFVRRSDSDWVY